jgi:hypothetical protein
MDKQRLSWDKRAWAFGFVAGNLVGFAMFILPEHRNRQAEWFTQQIFVGAAIILLVLGFLIAPAVNSALAHRRTFLWGLLPLGLVSLWFARLIDKTNTGPTFTGQNWWVLPTMFVICWLISSGPVSLIRWLLRRAREKQKQSLALIEHLREAASVAQAGVWPPPPKQQ